MNTNKRNIASLVGQALAAVALVSAAQASVAQSEIAIPATAVASPKLSEPRVQALEQLFWACDYVATTRGSGAAIAECYTVTEDFKNARFGGDFLAMLEWWKVNKPAEHAKLSLMEARP